MNRRQLLIVIFNLSCWAFLFYHLGVVGTIFAVLGLNAAYAVLLYTVPRSRRWWINATLWSLR